VNTAQHCAALQLRLIITAAVQSSATMNIYIDEAGAFLPTERENYVSSATALIVPVRTEEFLFHAFLNLRTSWGSPRSEIKGSTLS